MRHQESDRPVAEAPRGTGLMSWALRTVGAAGLLCIVAIQFLAGATTPDPAATRQLARAPDAVRDPETTGSIAARSVRLDPCALSARGARP